MLLSFIPTITPLLLQNAAMSLFDINQFLILINSIRILFDIVGVMDLQPEGSHCVMFCQPREITLRYSTKYQVNVDFGVRNVW